MMLLLPIKPNQGAEGTKTQAQMKYNGEQPSPSGMQEDSSSTAEVPPPPPPHIYNINVCTLQL